MKQETLEEVAERFYGEEEIVNDYDISGYLQSAFLTGAKWQAERMYSEEEVRNIVEQTIEKFYKHRYVETKSEMKELWFEQFKKK